MGLAREIESLKIPDLRVISAEGWRALYSRDQADVPDLLRNVLFQSMPGVVVQPFSVDAVAKVLRFAASKQLPIVIRGAGSSPFGGSMPVKGGIVLDMNAMDRVLDFDAAKGHGQGAGGHAMVRPRVVPGEVRTDASAPRLPAGSPPWAAGSPPAASASAAFPAGD